MREELREDVSIHITTHKWQYSSISTFINEWKESLINWLIHQKFEFGFHLTSAPNSIFCLWASQNQRHSLSLKKPEGNFLIVTSLIKEKKIMVAHYDSHPWLTSMVFDFAPSRKLGKDQKKSWFCTRKCCLIKLVMINLGHCFGH